MTPNKGAHYSLLLFRVDSTPPLSKGSGEDIIFLTSELMLFHVDSTPPLPSKGSGEDIIFLTSELSHCSYSHTWQDSYHLVLAITCHMHFLHFHILHISQHYIRGGEREGGGEGGGGGVLRENPLMIM